MKRIKQYLCIICCIGVCFTGCSLQPGNRYYKKAMKAYEMENFAEAETYFLQAIAKNQEKADYYIDYGFALLELNRQSEAIAVFEHVVLTDKRIPLVLENNKKAFRGIGISYFKNNEYEKAIESFQAALDLTVLPELNSDILSYQAKTLEYAGRLSEAAEIYTQLIDQDKDNAALYRARAEVYRKQKEYELSLADYDEALKTQTDNFELYFGKFTVLRELGRDAETEEVLSKASGLNFITDMDKFHLAKIHFYQKNYEVAEVELKNALSAGISDANYFLAEINLNREMYEEAKNYYLQYLDNGGTVSAVFYNQLMVCYLKLSEYEKAQEALEEANRYSTVTVAKELLRNEIILLEEQGDFSAALDKMEQYRANYEMDTETKKDDAFLKNRVEAMQREQELKDKDIVILEEESSATVKP